MPSTCQWFFTGAIIDRRSPLSQLRYYSIGCQGPIQLHWKESTWQYCPLCARPIEAVEDLNYGNDPYLDTCGCPKFVTGMATEGGPVYQTAHILGICRGKKHTDIT